MLFDKVIIALDAALVGALVARYLGPSDVGTLAYYASVVAIAISVVTFGTDSILVRQFIKHPDKRGKLLWSAFLMRIVFASVLFFSLSIREFFVQNTQSDMTNFYIMAVSALPLLASPAAVFRLILDAELTVKWHIVITNIIMFILAVVKLGLIQFSAPSVMFALVLTIQTASSFISGFIIVKRGGLLPTFEILPMQEFRLLMIECWPLFLSTVSIVLYMNLDVLMLNEMKGPTEAGIYSVAKRLSSIWYILPVSLATSYFPKLTSTYMTSKTNYEKQLNWFFDINSIIALLCVFIALLTFPFLIRTFYGSAFESSVSVFYYFIWGLPFVFMGVARGLHLMLEGQHKFSFAANIIGLFINLLLNYLLIPVYGAKGAAIAMVVSLVSINFVISFLDRKVRPIGIAQAKSLFAAPWRLYNRTIT